MKSKPIIDDTDSSRPCAPSNPALNRSFSRRVFLGQALLLFASGAGLGSITPAWASTVYKVGAATPKTGPDSKEALSFHAGVRLFLKENPEASEKIKLIVENTGPNGQKIIKTLTDLTINLKVNFLISSPNLDSSIQTIQAAKGSWITVMVTNPSARLVGGEMCNPSNFRATPNTYQESAILVPWAVKNVGLRVFITGEDEQSSNERADFFANECEASGAKFVDRIMLQKDHKNLKDILEAISNKEPDFVYASFKGKAAVEFIKGYRSPERKIKSTLLGPDCLTAYPGVLNKVKGLAEDIKTVTHLKTPSQLAQRLDNHGLGTDVIDIGWSAAGFDTMAVISHAIEKAGPKSAPGKEIAGIISKSSIEGSRGLLRFDANNEPVLKAYLQKWGVKDEGFRHTIVANLGENKSPDFGCGNIGFPKSNFDEDLEEEEDSTPSLPGDMD
jgi:ABC-type branched-subunit amino acid transport system substrate-binding protein